MFNVNSLILLLLEGISGLFKRKISTFKSLVMYVLTKILVILFFVVVLVGCQTHYCDTVSRGGKLYVSLNITILNILPFIYILPYTAYFSILQGNFLKLFKSHLRKSGVEQPIDRFIMTSNAENQFMRCPMGQCKSLASQQIS
jgi:hypothetical protein